MELCVIYNLRWGKTTPTLVAGESGGLDQARRNEPPQSFRKKKVESNRNAPIFLAASKPR